MFFATVLFCVRHPLHIRSIKGYPRLRKTFAMSPASNGHFQHYFGEWGLYFLSMTHYCKKPPSTRLKARVEDKVGCIFKNMLATQRLFSSICLSKTTRVTLYAITSWDVTSLRSAVQNQDHLTRNLCQIVFLRMLNTLSESLPRLPHVVLNTACHTVNIKRPLVYLTAAVTQPRSFKECYRLALCPPAPTRSDGQWQTYKQTFDYSWVPPPTNSDDPGSDARTASVNLPHADALSDCIQHSHFLYNTSPHHARRATILVWRGFTSSLVHHVNTHNKRGEWKIKVLTSGYGSLGTITLSVKKTSKKYAMQYVITSAVDRTTLHHYWRTRTTQT